MLGEKHTRLQLGPEVKNVLQNSTIETHFLYLEYFIPNVN